MDTYKIIRYRRNFKKDTQSSKVIMRGLSLEEAQSHCQREDTQKKDSCGNIIWFDGYMKE